MSGNRKLNFGDYILDTGGVLSRNGVRVRIRKQQLCVLQLLLENAGEVVSYEQFLDHCWRDTAGGIENVTKAVSDTRKVLDRNARGFIETIAGRGYRFVGEVREGDCVRASVTKQDLAADVLAGSVGDDITPAPVALNEWGPNKQGQVHHGTYVLTCCLIYACHHVATLLLEVAYRFDIYGRKIILVSPLFWGWTLISSLFGLRYMLKVVERGKNYGLAAGISIFLIAASLVILGAWLTLPASPVTEAKFQTYGAVAAYLKDTEYIVPVILVFLIVPFHLLVVLEREAAKGRRREVIRLLTGSRRGIVPSGAIYLRPWVLGLVVLLFAAYSLIARSHLFDNLVISQYSGLFEVLHQLKTTLLFGLALYSLAWYYGSLNRLKGQCTESLP